jgi:hypothetical protein
MGEWLCVVEVIVGLTGFGYALYSNAKNRTEREWVHTALINLKPGIQGENRSEVIKSIDNMLEFLKPPQKKKRAT